MKQEEKELLLKDLCGKLSYGVIVATTNLAVPSGVVSGVSTKNKVTVETKHADIVFDCTEVKPYLRPMSSMTEEEIEELKTLCSIYIPTDSPTIGFEEYGILVFTHNLTNNTYLFKLNISVIDWLNKNMFDYRGLITMGLAIEVTEENNPYKE